MKLLVVVTSVVLLGVSLSWSHPTNIRNLKVHVYTERPVHTGEKNTLICHLNEFHPQSMSAKLTMNGVEIANSHEAQADTSSQQDRLGMTKYAEFVPHQGDKIACVVSRNEHEPKNYQLDCMLML
ncbi:beta-2-microglobulin-like [Pelobates cultripes]|uniref:Beta-2-microglobulin-like n=1 Tax=Pelobates cultripes TaxID=61616 RepID=A0AAD1RPU5_PELCU|nr:beta-2-microglobulin-like [Pelobates cultripes]